MKRSLAWLVVFSAALVASDAAANDSYRVEGTAQERHAQNIFTGVFGQCRVPAAKANGVLALVFEVGPSGKFGATSTFKESQGRDVLRQVSQCLGARANKARPFPKSDSRSLVGVKFSVASDGKLLVLGTSEAATLSDGEMFKWARQTPSQPGA